MSIASSIEWTDATWNPVRGCVKVSPGCANCYAETFAERWRGVHGHPYAQGFDLRLVPGKLTEPLSWKKPRRVFVNSMSDLFQDGVPDSYIDQVFAVMALARQHTFQVLTKRADRMRDYLRVMGAADDTPDGYDYQDRWDTARQWLRRALLDKGERASMGRPEYVGVMMAHQKWPLPNVWVGCSVENQHFADERIPLLLQTPAAVRFISAEPLLGSVDLSRFLPVETIGGVELEQWLDWVIVGGESGPGARPCQRGWVGNIVAQCRDANVAVFVKQLGAHVIDRNDVGFEGDTARSWPMDTDVRENITGFREDYQGDPVRIVLRKKGGIIEDWPRELRVREFPSQRAVRDACEGVGGAERET